PLNAIIWGGKQEKGLWSGTQNIPVIIGFAKALELTVKNQNEEKKRLTELRNKLIDEVLSSIPNAKLNGPKKNRLANNINISLPNIDAKEFLFHLDEAGIACSSGSACDMSKNKISNTLKAIGLSLEQANASLRFTLGQSNTKNDINKVIKTITKIYHG
ncbi:aminotransferase class V-fold PLP-dependent enzyme, partial [Candidatus Peregrinibacteria bacterium]|nr:aminotransferase class V-fold PLP-dependent enzyme [Candidatus Peregrinibacteria bacterium]